MVLAVKPQPNTIADPMSKAIYTSLSLIPARATAAFLETEKHFKRIGGYKQMWMPKSYLDDLKKDKALAEKRKAG